MRLLPGARTLPGNVGAYIHAARGTGTGGARALQVTVGTVLSRATPRAWRDLV